MKKYLKNLLVFVCLLSLSFISIQANAQLLNSDGQENVIDHMKKTGDGADYNTQGDENDFLISDVASTVVTAFLGLLGIIFLVMILIGGFNWMTAAGNDDKVTKARATLIRGVIGLVIVLAAYMISVFVFKALQGIVGSPN